jgi:hypothetical protein
MEETEGILTLVVVEEDILEVSCVNSVYKLHVSDYRMFSYQVGEELMVVEQVEDRVIPLVPILFIPQDIRPEMGVLP